MAIYTAKSMSQKWSIILKTILLIFPHRICYFDDQNHVPWIITADNGQSQAGVSQVHLWGNVKLLQPPARNSHNMTMTTSSLIIFPEKQLAQTDQPVVITEPGTVINGVGLRANLNTGEIQLLSQARGVYKSN